jgi:hypothetical protein
VNPDHEVWQVFTIPFEQEGRESREDGVCLRHLETPVPIWMRSRGFKLEQNISSLANLERQVTIEMGEKYPE